MYSSKSSQNGGKSYQQSMAEMRDSKEAKNGTSTSSMKNGGNMTSMNARDTENDMAPMNGSMDSKNGMSMSSMKNGSSMAASQLSKRIDKCFEKRAPTMHEPCMPPTKAWQRGYYRKDSCGSGIIPVIHSYEKNRRVWCKTPLSTYQSTIGELGRKVLCREADGMIVRDIRNEPPCNICENVLPPCRGYYRKYDCVRPCEEEYATVKGGKSSYRDIVTRYWDPCTAIEKPDVNSLAPHNAMLAKKLHRGTHGAECW